MVDLAQLKKKKGNTLKTLQKKLEEQNQGGKRDERIWKPKLDKEAGKGTCIVRFLPPKDNCDPFVELMTHQFRGPGGNYWENSRRTLGEEDPVNQAAIYAFRKRKATKDERYKEEGKKFLPKSKYYANVLVIKDDMNPEAEGQVKIFEFGRQIYLFLEKALTPEFDDQDPMDPFDLWDGADFKIRMVGKEIPDQRNPGQKVLVPNYENSEFDRQSVLFDGDEEAIVDAINKTYDLSEFVDPKEIKDFDTLAARFEKVFGKPYNYLDPDAAEEHVQRHQVQHDMDSDQDQGSEPASEPAKQAPSEPPFDPDEEGFGDGDDESKAPANETALERFKRLAKNSQE